MHLDRFDNKDFDRGASRLKEGLWNAVSGILFKSWLPGSVWRVLLLRLFGADIREGVVIKPHVRIKFPWRLSIGQHSWIGEGAWIDNLAKVTIGSNVCISQGVYICTGTHDWSKDSFDLMVQPIEVGDGAWICAKAVLAPGCVVGEGAVVAMNQLATGQVEQWTIRKADGKFPRPRPGEIA